ncbi:hypothetical protein BDV95DRAFT_223571 [Massariosphaeria phaeospora]|uniref:Uncharacterized protein n=1 Tax=Massariosphaeria phaeospora TaxID=100035 RepID=A0A7C8IHA4_9PLEO|nr:hypothetical protein BDV95DRAFT_223571 [Massariosphaeria phaeospora]
MSYIYIYIYGCLVGCNYIAEPRKTPNSAIDTRQITHAITETLSRTYYYVGLGRAKDAARLRWVGLGLSVCPAAVPLLCLSSPSYRDSGTEEEGRGFSLWGVQYRRRVEGRESVVWIVAIGAELGVIVCMYICMRNETRREASCRAGAGAERSAPARSLQGD